MGSEFLFLIDVIVFLVYACRSQHCKKAFSEQECIIEEVIIKSRVSKKCVCIILDQIPILVLATITLKYTCVIFKSLL